MPHEHSARRRGRFIAPVSLHKQIHISALPNICIHIITHTYPIRQIPAFISLNTYLTIIKHVHSFHRIRIFTSPHTHFPPPLRGRLRICGRDKSDPYSCERIAIMLLTVCNNAANKLQYTHVHPRNTILLHHKHHTFAPQKPYFLHHKKPLLAPQKPTFRTANTYRRQIGRVAKTFC